MCSMVTEVINYYSNNGSSVYVCMLDASKAFDRVNLLTRFKTLYSNGICPIYVRLLMKIYEEQKNAHQMEQIMYTIIQ